MRIPIIKFDSLIKDAVMRKFHIPDKITIVNFIFMTYIFLLYYITNNYKIIAL